MCEHNRRAEEGRYCAYCEADKLRLIVNKVTDLVDSTDAIGKKSVKVDLLRIALKEE